MTDEERLLKEQRMKNLAASDENTDPQNAVLEDSMHAKLDSLLTKAQLFSEFLLEKMDRIASAQQDSEESKDGRRKGRGVKRKTHGVTSIVSRRAATEACPQLPDGQEKNDVEGLCHEFVTEEERVAVEQKKIVPLLSGGTLKPFQLKGIKWIISLWQNGLNGILADQTGLGKTIQAIGLLAHLKGHNLQGPFLVCAPPSTLSSWVRKIKKWVPVLPALLYHGSKEERAEMRRKLPDSQSPEFPVIVTSYEVVMSDHAYLARSWKYVIVDEGHRRKNFDCKLLRELMKVPVETKLLLSGIPLQNNLGELWLLLNFISPDMFCYLEQFESWFDFSGKQRGSSLKKKEMDEQRRLGVITKLHGILRPFLLRRLRENVLKNIPPKKEIIFYAELADAQKKYQDLLLTRALNEHFEARKLVDATYNVVMQLRKNASHPDLLESHFSENINYPSLEVLLEQCGKSEKMADEERLLKEQRMKNLAASDENTDPQNAVLEDSMHAKLDSLLTKTQLFSEFLLEKMDKIASAGQEPEEPKEGRRKGRGVKRTLDEFLTKEERVAVEQKKIVPLLSGGTVKPFQLKGIKWMISLWQNGLNGILADQVGVGKTIQAIGLLAHLKGQDLHGPFLVCAPLSILSHWVRKIKKWVPDLPALLYHGSMEERAEMRRKLPDSQSPEFPVIVTSFEVAMSDRAYLARRRWKYVVVYVGHGLNKFDYKLLRKLRKVPVENNLLMTGAPLQNNLGELWSLLNFILPEIFCSLEQFELWFDFSGKQSGSSLNKEEMDEKRRLGVITKLQGILRPFLLRRLKEDVMNGT